MTETMKPSVVEDLDKGRVLSAEDLFSGGEEPVQRLELPMIVKDGKPGVTFIRKISTDEVLAHNDMTEGEGKRDDQLRLFAKAVCKNISGDALFTDKDDERLGQIPIGAFNLIMSTIVGDMGVETQAGGDVETEKNG